MKGEKDKGGKSKDSKEGKKSHKKKDDGTVPAARRGTSAATATTTTTTTTTTSSTASTPAGSATSSPYLTPVSSTGGSGTPVGGTPRNKSPRASGSSSGEALVELPSRQTEPMPSEQEVVRRFDALLEELSIPRAQREPMAQMKPEQKWQFVANHLKSKELANQKGTMAARIKNTPQYFMNLLKTEVNQSVLESLRVALSTCSLTWIQSFHEIHGLDLLVALLGEAETRNDHEMMTELIRCLKAAMNNKVGFEGVLSIKGAVGKIALCFDPKMPRRSILVLQLLSAACFLSADGTMMVVDAFSHYRKVRREKERFRSLVDSVRRADSYELQATLLSFVNALVNTPEDVDFRIALRAELLKLGLARAIDELRRSPGFDSPESDIRAQVDIFEREAKADQDEVADRFESLDVDINDPDAMFKLLKRQLKDTERYEPFLAALRNMLLIPATESGVKAWVLSERLLKQIALLKQTIVLDEHRTKLEDLFTAVEDRSHLLTAQARLAEVEKGATKLESQVRALESELRDKDHTIRQLQMQLGIGGAGGGPDNATTTTTAAAAAAAGGGDGELGALPPIPGGEDGGEMGALPAIPGEEGAGGGGGGPPPPPPPGGGPPGGPPPPPGAPGMGSKAPPLKKRKVPKPDTKMKGLAWQKLPNNKIMATFWGKPLDPAVPLDIKEVEALFSAAPPPELSEDAAGGEDAKAKGAVTLLDPKRAQNVAILLTHIKTSNRGIIAAILAMDDVVIGLDTARLLLQYCPTKEEYDTIDAWLAKEAKKAKADRSELGKAEQFFRKLRKVPNLAERLAAFVFKLEFPLKVEELRPDLRSLKFAIQETRDCKKLQLLMEVILYIGNFLNGGTFRGDAYGFKLDSLLKLGETRSANGKLNLLHYLVGFVHRSYPELRDFSKELDYCAPASKVSFSTIVAELADLRKSMAKVEASAAKVSKVDELDRFGELVPRALKDAAAELASLETLLRDVEAGFKPLAELYGEDAKTISPEDFFTIFARFIQAYDKAWKDLERDQDAQEKAAKRAQEKKKREDEMAKKKAQLEQQHAAQADEGKLVDDIFAAIKVGDYSSQRRTSIKGNPARLAPRARKDSVDAAANQMVDDLYGALPSTPAE